jgi:hypothetical protein
MLEYLSLFALAFLELEILSSLVTIGASVGFTEFMGERWRTGDPGFANCSVLLKERRLRKLAEVELFLPAHFRFTM